MTFIIVKYPLVPHIYLQYKYLFFVATTHVLRKWSIAPKIPHPIKIILPNSLQS